MTKKKVNELIELHLIQASQYASTEIEKLARKVLREHKHLKSFTMAMGTYFFIDVNGNNIDTKEERSTGHPSYNYYMVDTFKYFKPLNDFIMKWDDELKVTGDAMHFTATGKKITEW